MLYICHSFPMPSPKIYNVKEPLNLERLRLAKPINKNGSHFIKTLDIDDPIYFLGPKCFTKTGFVKSGKKIFCDFVFSNEDSEFFAWLENLEETSRKCIFDNRETWFETPLDEHDIESSMTPAYKPYKSGKYFIVRANVPNTLDKINIKVYDENEQETEPENVKENTRVLAVLEFQGIRCSVRSFQFEIELKQLLIVEPERLFETCIIGKNTASRSSTNQVSGGGKPHSGVNQKSVDLDIAENSIAFRSLSSVNETDTSVLPSSDGPKPDEFHNQTIDDHKSNEREDDISSANQGFDHFDGKPSTESLIGENEGGNRNQNRPNKTNLEVPVEIFDDDFPLEDITDSNTGKEPPLRLKSRNDVYYKLYKEMRQRAKEAKREALANYLEAKRIKNTYLLEDLSESESDEEDHEKYLV